MKHICAVIATTLLAGSAFAATINVPGDYSTIQEAVDAAMDGDEIAIAPGTYYEFVSIQSKGIRLYSTGKPETTFIDGEGIRNCLDCTGEGTSPTEIEGVTFQNGYGSSYGAVLCQDSSPTFLNCHFIGNTSLDRGGAMRSWSSDPYLSNCLFEGNTASLGGGLEAGASGVTIEGCMFRLNNSSSGGAVRFSGSGGGESIITGSSFMSNQAQSIGGAVSVHDNYCTFENCLISENVSLGSGGGIYIQRGPVNIQNSSLTGNTAKTLGGGCFTDGGAEGINISSTDVSNNQANLGGGIYSTSTATVYLGSCTLTGNIATTGGAFYGQQESGFTTYISNCIACENTLPQLIGSWTDGGSNLITELCGLGACCTGNNEICVETNESDCNFFGGTFSGYGVACSEVECPNECLGDVTGDGQVNVNDLLTVIANWNDCP